MKRFDVIGLGNSLLDITFEVDDSILDELGLKKSEMRLIDKEKNKEILKKLKDKVSNIHPGGSSANTIAGVSILGGNAAFIGMIGDDALGSIYEEKTIESKVFSRFSKHLNESTGNTITFITPDKERSFAVYLGASIFLDENNIEEEMIKDSNILHLEGYSLEEPRLRRSCIKAINIAEKNRLKISLDLNDSSLIQRNHEFLKNLIKEHIDILFVNEDEAKAFTGKEPVEALDELSKLCDTAIVKLGSKGSIIKQHGKIINIPSFKIDVVNTNGAGDMYAAGILLGISRGMDLKKAGELASFAASLVVKSSGARLEKSLISELDKYKKEKGL